MAAGDQTDEEKKAALITDTNTKLTLEITNTNTKIGETPIGISGEVLIYYKFLLQKRLYYLQNIKQWLIDDINSKTYSKLLEYTSGSEDIINLNNITDTINYRVITYKYVMTVSGILNDASQLKTKTTKSFIRNTVKDISNDSIIFDVKGQIENLQLGAIPLNKLLAVPLGLQQIDYFVNSYISDLYREPYHGYNYLSYNFQSLNANIMRIFGEKTKAESYSLSEIFKRFIKGLFGGIFIFILAFSAVACGNMYIHRPLPFRVIFFVYGIIASIPLLFYFIYRKIYYNTWPVIYSLIIPLIKYDTSLLPSILDATGNNQIIDERKWYYKLIHYIEDTNIITKAANEYRAMQEAANEYRAMQEAAI